MNEIPKREELLKEAYIKLYGDNDDVKLLLPHLTIEDYVVLLYSKCTPSQYGILFEEKLINNLKEYVYAEKLDKRYECGDVYLRYPINNMGVGYCNYKQEISKFEVKFSYVNKKNSFNIRNIRLYNNFDYLILGVCNPQHDFGITYYCIKKEELEKIGLTPMNGTKKSNKNNENICYGTTISCYSFKEFKLSDLNVLKGGTYNDLLKFISDKQIELRENFITKICDELCLNIEEQKRFNPDSELLLKNEELCNLVG